MQQLHDGLVAIVAVEGPVEGHRLHTAYVKAAGGQRVGKSVAKILNSAITAAVRQGRLAGRQPTPRGRGQAADLPAAGPARDPGAAPRPAHPGAGSAA